jgi:two-component system, LuxR family, response regulator FixJ
MTPAQPPKPTVFVVDDDGQMRESLVTLITAMHFPARGFASAGSFHKYYRPSMAGCLVLDIKMPVQNGLELYEQLIREGKRLPVIYITAHADVSMAVSAMKTGAIEFLEKPFDRGTLLERIHKALALDANWRKREADYNALDARITRLSERERETLHLILSGASNKAMAAKLYISERAVEMRRAAIMRKLQIRSLAELLELAVTHRILGEIVQSRADSWWGLSAAPMGTRIP